MVNRIAPLKIRYLFGMKTRWASKRLGIVPWILIICWNIVFVRYLRYRAEDGEKLKKSSWINVNWLKEDDCTSNSVTIPNAERLSPKKGINIHKNMIWWNHYLPFFCYWTHLKASNLLATKNIRAVRAVVNIAALMLNYLNFSSSRW